MKRCPYYLVLFLLLVGSACERNPKKPGFEFLADMAHSIPYDAFTLNLLPPSGSIPRGFIPLHYGTSPSEAERAGREMTNPIPLTPATLARGKKVYETFCLVCHGVAGKGDGPLIPKYPNPPSYTSKNVREYPAGRLFHIITYGTVSNSGEGMMAPGLMAPYAAQISQEDRWKLVHYVRMLQRPQVSETRVSSETMPSNEKGRP